jgi:hypothetical protein
MTDIPVITAIDKTERGSTDEWPSLLFIYLKTETGPFVIRMTGEAAHQLKGMLNDLPPKIGKVSPAQKLD